MKYIVVLKEQKDIPHAFSMCGFGRRPSPSVDYLFFLGLPQESYIL